MLLDEITAEFFKIVYEARSHSLGPFSPEFSIQRSLLESLGRLLPPDAHLILTNRLHISLTRVLDMKNVIVSHFNSREDLFDALACSFFIPGYSGLIPPTFHGVRYIDGAFTDNQVELDENTITVSPFCGETNICPKDPDTNAERFIVSGIFKAYLTSNNSFILIR